VSSIIISVNIHMKSCACNSKTNLWFDRDRPTDAQCISWNRYRFFTQRL